MKTLKFDDQLSWLEARKTKITGSRLKDIIVKRGTGQKIGFYELIAERIAKPADGENPMDRGHRLEEEAMELFEKQTKKVVDKSLVLWVRDDNDSIAVSPDGFIGETEALEVKCLASARHIEALLKDEIPSEYLEQVYQYFIVNNKLETLYFCFYDPRLTIKNFFYKTVNIKDIKEEVIKLHVYQEDIIKQVNEIVNQLTF